MSSNRALIEDSVAAAATRDLAARCLDEYDQIVSRYRAGDHRPTELSGGRFAEAMFRVCQHVCTGAHEPLGKPLTRVDKVVAELEATPSGKADDTFRIHIPRALRLLYDLRNKRDVAHLGTGVSPNKTDAALVVGTTSWVLSDVVRCCHGCDIEQAQRLVDSLVERKLPLVWHQGDVVRVLEPSMAYSDQVLLLLHYFEPDPVIDARLREWCGYSPASAFRSKVLRRLHDDAAIHYADGVCRLLPPGMRRVDELLRRSV